MKSSASIIANPAAKGATAAKLKLAEKMLKAAGYDVNLRTTSKRGDAEEFARKDSGSGADLILAAGGDGTFNEVINGMVQTSTPMAILPMGTTNVLAKELGIPERVERAVERAIRGSIREVSVGKVTTTGGKSPVSRFFCLMAGIGYDADSVYYSRPDAKRITGKGAYFLGGLKALAVNAPECLGFVIDGAVYEGYQAIIGKASKYGGNFRVTPDASLFEPSVFVCIMQGKSRSDILRYVWGILSGTHLRMNGIVYRKAFAVEITGNARIQIDGDYFGRTPAVVTVVPGALQLKF